MYRQTIRYEVIGRAKVEERGGHEEHYLKLLYKGDGTPWWCCTAGMELMIDPNFEARPGDRVVITIEAQP